MKNGITNLGAARLLLAALLMCVQAAAAGLQGQLNLNEATVEELELLPEIGAVRAQAIVDYRSRHGRFSSLGDLTEVSGIGPRTLRGIRPYLRLSGSSDLRSSEPQRAPPSLSSPPPGGLQMLADQGLFDVLIQRIKGAHRRIDIATYVFRLGQGEGNRPAQLVRELGEARRRGVRVRVLLERDDHAASLNRDNQAAAAALRAEAVEVRFDQPETTSHMKLVVIDGRYSLVGSHNLTHSALRYNHEVSLLVDDPVLADNLLRYMDAILTP